MKRVKLFLLAVSGLAAAAWLFVSCSTVGRTVISPPHIEGATFVGNRTCYDCHTNYVRVFSASPHSRVRMEHDELPGGTGCESCHGPGSKHVAAGGGRGKFIINPGKEPAACFNCHIETRAEFHLPQHHPLIEGKMNCVQCHDPHGMDILKPARGLAMARTSESCAQCHREQARPRAFGHEALREGCAACHQPHGSVNAAMLVARDNNLCLKCHAQSPGPAATPGRVFIGASDHTGYLSFGSCYTSGCHASVHGSDIDRLMRY